mgnify:CR=1 FL=1
MFMYTDYTQHLLDNVKKIHFIGCGGSGMYPLIQILSAKGYDISGSDVLDGSIIESRRLGQLYVGTEHMWLGILANPNCKAAELLAQEHIAAQVVKLNRVTPLDGDAVCGALAGVRRLVVLEDQLRQGCVGQRLAALLLERGAAPEKLRLLNAGERLPAQGSVRQLYHALGLDAQGVVCAVKEVLA